MKNSKMGRPPIANPRKVKKCLLMTEAEAAVLKETAAIYGISQNAAAIRAFMEMHQRAKNYDVGKNNA